MHSKVPSSFMLVVMADGLPNLCSKKLVHRLSHAELSRTDGVRKRRRATHTSADLYSTPMCFCFWRCTGPSPFAIIVSARLSKESGKWCGILTSDFMSSRALGASEDIRSRVLCRGGQRCEKRPAQWTRVPDLTVSWLGQCKKDRTNTAQKAATNDEPRLNSAHLRLTNYVYRCALHFVIIIPAWGQ